MEPQPPKHAPATRARSPGILPDRTGSRRGAAGGVDGDGVGGVENRSRIGAAPGAAGDRNRGPRACPRDRPRRSRRRARGPSREVSPGFGGGVRDRRVERRRHRRGRGPLTGTNRGRPIDDGSKAPRSHSSTVRVMHRPPVRISIVYSACDASSRAFRLYSSRPAPLARAGPLPALRDALISACCWARTRRSRACARQESVPEDANTTCLSSSHSVLARVMKNWHPLELGPLLAMLGRPGPVCRRQGAICVLLRRYSAPVPFPFRKSPPWIMKSLITRSNPCTRGPCSSCARPCRTASFPPSSGTRPRRAPS